MVDAGGGNGNILGILKMNVDMGLYPSSICYP